MGLGASSFKKTTQQPIFSLSKAVKCSRCGKPLDIIDREMNYRSESNEPLCGDCNFGIPVLDCGDEIDFDS